MALTEKLRGTGVALITPFKQNSEVDFTALEKVINHILDGGVEYLISMGTTGEPSTLSKEERLAVIKETFRIVNERVPVIVGVGSNNTAEVLKGIASLPLEKATALLHASPYYNRPSQEGIFQHYQKVAEASPVPVIVYNVPSRTGSNVSAETTLRLAKECGNIGGIKEASGNMGQCMSILKNRPADFLVVSGDDMLALPLIACGMDGVISVAANAFPKEFSSMVRFALQNDFAESRKLHYRLLEAYELMFIENNPAGVKDFMAKAGLLENVLRLPLVPLSKKISERVAGFSPAN